LVSLTVSVSAWASTLGKFTVTYGSKIYGTRRKRKMRNPELDLVKRFSDALELAVFGEVPMSKAKQKGTAAETAVVNYLKDNGFPYAERRALHGNLDKGDITGCGPIVFEVKDHAKITLSAWLKELEDEMINADAGTGAVIAKRRGTTKVKDWYAIMPVCQLVDLLKEAGY